MSGIRILLVEDDDAHRETLARHLTRTGWAVTAAETAEEALNVLAAVSPDLVLTDVRMPGMSGIQMLSRIRAHRDVAVVVMTAYSDMGSAIEAMKNGAYDYLTKPLDLDALDTVLRRCVAECVQPAESGSSAAASAKNELIGRDSRMLAIYKTIGTIAAASTPVLIRGETGTGKELIAKMIHAHSPRADEPFIAINCTAVPDTLLESELFGHLRGSFTGAVADRKGRFELASAGTVFLDEIGDTPVAFQAKLLRVVQEKEYYPVGGERPRVTRARIIAATHRPIERLIADGSFREDLYYRLRVVEINIPPLRERRADIPLLVRHILRRLEAEIGKELRTTDETMSALMAHDWPGNVRELENALTRAAVFARGTTLTLEQLKLAERTGGVETTEDDRSLESVERAHVQRVLELAGRNKSRAARMLGVSRPRLDRMIARHGLSI